MLTLQHYREARALKRVREVVGDGRGGAKGWHKACPGASPGMLGTYKLVLDNEGHVACEACGAHDLAPYPPHPYWDALEALDEARKDGSSK